MSRAWMPLYVADYLADTGHLSAAEHGAYLLLIMHYWQNGGLPNEDRRLARIARMSPPEWEDSRDVLFDLFDDGWTHGRIEEELKAARDISEKAKEKAAKRWHKPSNADAYAEADAAAMQEHMPEACQSQSQPPTTTESNDPVVVARPAPKSARGTRLASGAEMSERNRADASRIGVPADRVEPLWQRYRDYWTAKPGKDAVKLDWDATWRNWCSSECERRGWAPSSPSQTGSDPPCGIKISPVTDPDAWEAWRQERGGKPLPTDKTGAWTVPSRFPRPHTSTEEAAA